MSSFRNRSAGWVLALCLMLACGSSSRPALPRLPARSMDAWTEVEGLRVAAQAYADAEQQRQLFQREIGRRYGLLPVFLVIENAGTETLVLRRSWIVFSEEGGRSFRASRSAETVERALGDEGLDWEKAVGNAETLYHRRFDLGLSYLFGEALPSKVDAAHYAAWQLPEEVSLGPGDRLRRFVFFEGKRRAAPAAAGTLSVRFRAAAGSPTARPSRSAILRLGRARPAQP